TAEMTSWGEACPSTVISPVSKFTEQSVTPGTDRAAFSTRALQAAQVMPFTIKCSMVSLLFHQLLEGSHQLVDDFQLVVLNVPHHAAADMGLQQLPVEAVDGGRGSSGLHQDVGTVGILLHHFPDSPD